MCYLCNTYTVLNPRFRESLQLPDGNWMMTFTDAWEIANEVLPVTDCTYDEHWYQQKKTKWEYGDFVLLNTQISIDDVIKNHYEMIATYQFENGIKAYILQSAENNDKKTSS